MMGFHNLRQSPAVDEQSSVELMIWRAFRTPSQTVHLVGVLPGTATVRATTQIIEVRPWGLEVLTESGRRYNLAAAPTEDDEWLSVIAARTLCLGADLIDVSGELWGRLLRGSV